MVPSRGPLHLTALLAALAAASAAAASQRQPYLLRHRSLPEESEKTNDDDHTIIDLFSFSLRLTDVPSTSPLAIVKGDDANLESDEVNAVIDLVEEMGAEVLGSHPVFGERYREWSAGEAWTSDFVMAPSGQGGSGGPPLPGGGEGALPSGAELSRSDGKRKLRGETLRKLQEPVGEATADEVAAPVATSQGEADPSTETAAANPTNTQEAAQPPASPAAKQTGTTVLTLPEGSVTFNGAYWEDDPSPLELTSYLVENLDEDELLVQLWPLVCSAKEIADGECNVGLEVASDAVDEAKEAEGGEGGGNGAQGGGPGANPGEGAQGSGEGNGETTDKGTVPGEPSVEGAGEAQEPNQGDDSGDDNNLKVIIPVVVGAALLAFLVAGLLYRRRKQRQADDATEDGQVLKTVATEDTPPEIPPEELSTAYDTITRPSASPTARTAAASPVAAVAAGAAIATAVAATASQQQASKDIDHILEDFSDSSYVSDSSAAPSEANTNDASVSLSGLSGILTDASPGPLDDAARNDSKQSYSADAAATGDVAKKDDDDDAGAGYLPKSLGSPSAGHKQKQEPFEDNYRSRSAMAIGLKKDMLHVACEAHDAGESTAKTDGAVENAGNGGYMHEAGMGYGVTRTLSPKKSTTLMEKQGLAEKLSLRPGRKGKKRREKEGEDELESSKDAILPSNFHRSDSDGVRGEPLGAMVDSGSDEEDDESGSFA